MNLIFAGAALSLGLVTGIHCVGMCGPLALALPVVGKSKPAYLAGRLIYNAGRAITYTIMGVLIGLAGEAFAIGGLQRWVSMGVGILILLSLALVYLGFMPRIMEALGIWKAFGKLQRIWKAQFQNKRYTGLLTLGLINGLLPCGPVYVALAGAAATGSAATAGLFMLLFGIGTLPMMLTVSLAGKLIQMPLRQKLQKLVPASAAIVAVLLILRGMALGIPYLSPPAEATSIGGDPHSCCGGAADDAALRE